MAGNDDEVAIATRPRSFLMSEKPNVKKIDLQTLDQADRKVSVVKLRRAATALAILIVAAGGAYAAFRTISGEVVASRFAVNKMTCPACVITVKEVTSKLPGVVETEVSLAAQDVLVKFRNKQTSPDQIQQVIAHAGYAVAQDGMFKASGVGIDDVLVAEVNGKPLFAKDLKVPFDVSGSKSRDESAAVFFSAVGKRILLQAADSATVVVQPSEIEQEVQAIAKDKGVSAEELVTTLSSNFGSREKYLQVVAQRLGIRKLLDETVLENVKDPQEKQRKTMEWAGGLFKDADVKILDPKVSTMVQTFAGQPDWKTFWPRMIAGDTELKKLLIP
jgi:periplasmic mercuric ion binding protein